QVAVPPTEELEKLYPSLCPRQRKSALVKPKAEQPAGGMRRAANGADVYIVSEGDTLFDIARYDTDRPFFLTVSFTHPHSPYTVQQQFWDLYRHEDIEMPAIAEIGYEQLDTYSQWLHLSHGRDEDEVSPEHVRNARHAYFGMISYVDSLIGRVLKALDDTHLAHDTLVIFTSDHGEMLGERGMWYKETFFEWSARVPLIVSAPERVAKGARAATLVSLVDLLPTLLDWLEIPVETIAGPIEGKSFADVFSQPDRVSRDRAAIGEYTDMGVCGPCRMIRQGDHKLIYAHGAKPLLYDLSTDPNELNDLAGQPEFAATLAQLMARLTADWDPQTEFDAVMMSQARRRIVKEAMQNSPHSPNWSYAVRRGDEHRYVRGSGFQNGTTATKAKARFPRFVRGL
ncbi:MAG: sulfatase-like hydrolase/transferase, partial [Betaproteobacteria bacterium]